LLGVPAFQAMALRRSRHRARELAPNENGAGEGSGTENRRRASLDYPAAGRQFAKSPLAGPGGRPSPTDPAADWPPPRTVFSDLPVVRTPLVVPPSKSL